MEIHNLKRAVCAAFLFSGIVGIAFAVDDGYVVKVDSQTIYLDWGSSSGVQKGDTFQIYAPGPELKHPVTGKVLGQTKSTTGAGFVTEVQEKFSVGEITKRETVSPKEGQRVHFQEPAPVAPAASPLTGTLAPAPRERWRTGPMKGEINGVAIGDLDGDGKKELVVAYSERVEVQRWNGKQLETVAAYKNSSDRNWITVETFDLQGTGKDLIFAGCVPPYANSRGKTIVLSFEKGELKEIARGDGFVRRVEHADGKPTLLLQVLSMSRQVSTSDPTMVVLDGKKLKAGDPYSATRKLNNEQLLGMTFGDWNSDGQEDLALLQGGERLRLYFGGGKEAAWNAPEVYGGTNAKVLMENDIVAWISPRLMARPEAKGPVQLWVPRNVAKFGVRTRYIKFYDRSEIVALAWSGADMTPLWRLPVESYVADFTVGDLGGTGTSQLWVAMQASGSKAVLIAFDIP